MGFYLLNHSEHIFPTLVLKLKTILSQYLKYIWSNIFYCQYLKNIWSNIFLCLLLLCIASRERKLVNSSHQLGSTLDFKQNPNFKFSPKSTNCFGRICIWIGNCKKSFLFDKILNTMNWRGSICNNHQFGFDLHACTGFKKVKVMMEKIQNTNQSEKKTNRERGFYLKIAWKEGCRRI